MAKKIVRLTESDLTRLIRKVINEQSRIKDGDTINFYLDPANKRPWGDKKGNVLNGTISSFQTNRNFNGVKYAALFLVKFQKNEMAKLMGYICGKPGFKEADQPDSPYVYYNKPIEDEITKQYCGVSKGGTTVPKATWTSAGQNQSDMS